MSHSKDLIKEYEVQIEGWHLFYESFEKYMDAIFTVRGVAVEMSSELIKVTKSNPNNSKLPNAKKRIDIIFSCMDSLEGLTNRCIKLSAQLKKNKEMYFVLEKENESLRNEINALKSSFNEQL